MEIRRTVARRIIAIDAALSGIIFPFIVYPYNSRLKVCCDVRISLFNLYINEVLFSCENEELAAGKQLFW